MAAHVLNGEGSKGMRGKWYPGFLGVLLFIILVLPSCAARNNQFKQFSQAGIAYGKAVTVVLDEAGTAAIDTDSMVLEKSRPDLSSEERGPEITQHNKLLRERLRLLEDLKRHARLLTSYFEALAALAEGGRPSGVSTAAEGVVASLAKLHSGIADAKIGGASISSLIGPIAGIAVGRFKSKALENELKKRAETIDRELELQKAALTAVAGQLRTDLQAQIQQEESQEVVLPFVRNDPLPKSWSDRRKEMLRTQVSLASVDSAADAAERLRIAFIALAEGRSQSLEFESVVSELNALVQLIEHAQGQEQKTK